MRIALSIILILTPLCNLKSQGIPALANGMAHAASAPMTETYGNTVTAGGTNQSSFDGFAIFVPFTTGSNAGGYSVSSVQGYGGAAAGNVLLAIFTDKATGCNTGTHCPSTLVCGDNTGVTALANAFTTDTPAACGTLAANTSYWIGQHANNASREYVYQSSPADCPTPVAFTQHSTYAGWGTTWSNVDIANNGQAGACYVQKIVLTLL